MHGAHLPPKAGIRCGADAVRAGVRAGVAGACAAAGGRRAGAAAGVRKRACQLTASCRREGGERARAAGVKKVKKKLEQIDTWDLTPSVSSLVRQWI